MRLPRVVLAHDRIGIDERINGGHAVLRSIP